MGEREAREPLVLKSVERERLFCAELLLLSRKNGKKDRIAQGETPVKPVGEREGAQSGVPIRPSDRC